MLRVYVFTDEGSSADGASGRVMEKVNKFLAQDVETNLIDVTNILQSESSCCSQYEGMTDWNYSFSITLVMNVHQSDVEKIHQMYLSS